ncbi:HAD family phosphatase [Patescibacteria group bacterium]|nr:HAD family phosphatase [Patescibacteria group bacterium]
MKKTIQKPKAVIFDVGGVVLDWKSAVPKVSKLLNISDEKMFEELWSHNVDMDLGKKHQDEFWKYLSEKYNPKANPMSLKKTWIEEQPRIEAGWGLLKEIKKAGLMTVCCTNNWKDTLEKQMEFHPDFSLFDHIFDSCYMGIRKPDEEIYKVIENEIGYSGAEIFFIDDVKENCEGAKKLNWNTFQFDCVISKGERDRNKIKEILNI